MQSVSNRLYVEPSAADGVEITPDATPWDNSAWVEIVAATDAAWVLTGIVAKPDGNTTVELVEIDIGVGAAASEVVVTTFRLTYLSAYYVSPGIVPCPIPLDNIDEGDRVSVRLRKSNATTDPWFISVQFYKKPILGTLMTTAKPQKTAPFQDNTHLSIGASAWADSTWTEIVASTSTAVVLVGLSPSIAFNYQYEFDVGIGGAGSEVVVTTIGVKGTGVASTDGPLYVPFYAPLDAIPASSRIAARTRTSNIASAAASLALVYIEKPL